MHIIYIDIILLNEKTDVLNFSVLFAEWFLAFHCLNISGFFQIQNKRSYNMWQ